MINNFRFLTIWPEYRIVVRGEPFSIIQKLYEQYRTQTFVRICIVKLMTNTMIGINNELFCSKSSQIMDYKLKSLQKVSINPTQRKIFNFEGKLVTDDPSDSDFEDFYDGFLGRLSYCYRATQR